jgi:hypothetical protein
MSRCVAILIGFGAKKVWESHARTHGFLKPITLVGDEREIITVGLNESVERGEKKNENLRRMDNGQ